MVPDFGKLKYASLFIILDGFKYFEMAPNFGRKWLYLKPKIGG